MDAADPDPVVFGPTIRTAWTALRLRPVSLNAGCGCGGGFGTLTARDFEEALVFHIHERWRHDPALAGLAALERLDDIIEWAGRAGDAPPAATRLQVLRDVKRSLDSFATTCAAHRFRADPV